MSTRIGRYIFDVDLKSMDIEKLSVLKEGCEHFIKEKHREDIHKALTQINLLAHTYGFDICVLDSDDYPQVMNEYTLAIKDRELGELVSPNSRRLIQPARQFNNFVTNLCLTFNILSVIIIMERGKERMTDENDLVGHGWHDCQSVCG